MNDSIKQNEIAWDKKSESKSLWSKPLTDIDVANILLGKSNWHLTPTKFVPKNWYQDIAYKKVLCLASGGGQQVVLFTLLKADVYAVDISTNQLKKDADTLQKYGLSAKLFHRSMTDLSIFGAETFDYVINPVSMTYIPSCYDAYKEVYRVLKKDGMFLHAMPNPMLYLFEDNYEEAKLKVVNKIPCSIESDFNSIEYSHTLEEIFGALTSVGFSIIGYYDDVMPNEALSKYISTYMAIRCKK